jgi:peptidoglycan-associated lipoprotein
VKESRRKTAVAVVALALLLVAAGCARRETAPPPPPPPPAPAPTASLSANPSTIQQGQSTQLTWRTENADQVMIEGIGPVDRSGSRSVTPTESTTYRLVARGPGGTQDATARVTVTAPPPKVEPTVGEAELFARNVRDIFYDYDRYDIRPDADPVLRRNADFLRQHPNIRIVIEGHCDERGSTEYNLALGDNRALAARDALVRLGVSADRIRVISFGKEKPFCTESNEQCWQQNRRAHFVMQR